MNKDNENKALFSAFSPQRLQPYLSKTDGNFAEAMELYKKNMRISAELYPILSCFEVCLRNKVHEVMQELYGIGWLMPQAKAPLAPEERVKIEEAYQRLREENKIGDDVAENMGRLIAMLSLGFWARLFGKKYEEALWRPVLHSAVPNYYGKLKVLRSRIYMIRRLRNRIAHHEPIIFHDNIDGRRDEILEVIGWMCTDTEEWVRGL